MRRKPLVFLDRQHAGRQGRRRGDLGASVDLNRDGQISMAEREAILTPQYLLAAEMLLRSRGYDVIPISDGSYSERHDRVNRYAAEAGHTSKDPAVYVAAHLNAGKGSYGSAFYHYRSSAHNGPQLAACIADHLRAFPQITEAKTFASKPSPHWTRNAFYTIRGLGSAVVAICYEPFFMDTKSHQSLLSEENLQGVGEALAQGIIDWSGGRLT